MLAFQCHSGGYGGNTAAWTTTEVRLVTIPAKAQFFNDLFRSCFRIASEADIPIVVENVKGAQRFVGPARWHYQSFYLWGDVPALMPRGEGRKVKIAGWNNSTKGKGFNVTAANEYRRKMFGWYGSKMQEGNTRSDSRKAASAEIAKIPFPLAQHIAKVFKP
jgi:hypothetical protein